MVTWRLSTAFCLDGNDAGVGFRLEHAVDERVEDVRALQTLVPRIPVTDEAVRLAVSLGRATRPTATGARERHPRARGGGVRSLRGGAAGSQALVLAAKARAALNGEAAADVEDVRALVVPVLRHRLVLSYRAEAEGVKDVDVLEKVQRALAG